MRGTSIVPAMFLQVSIVDQLINLITFTTAEKQAVVGVARQSKLSAPIYPSSHDIQRKTDHNTGNYMPYSLQQVCGFLNLTGL